MLRAWMMKTSLSLTRQVRAPGGVGAAYISTDRPGRRAGPARGAPKSKPLSPALPAPRPAKVKPPIKLPVPVIDARLRISFSKVPPLLSAVLLVSPDIIASRGGLLGVGTIRR